MAFASGIGDSQRLLIISERLEGYLYRGGAKGQSVGSITEGPGREAKRRIAYVARAHGSRLDLSGLGLNLKRKLPQGFC
jgi:hypothetical protein